MGTRSIDSVSSLVWRQGMRTHVVLTLWMKSHQMAMEDCLIVYSLRMRMTIFVDASGPHWTCHRKHFLSHFEA